MRMKRSLFCLLLAVILALTACGEASSPASTAETTAPDVIPSQETAPAEESEAPAPAETPAETETPAEPLPEEGEAPEVWDGLTFETEDLEGNVVSSRELFAAHTVTMVNVWASWCPPCVRELPELQRLNGEFAEKDCAIAGLLIDGDDPAGLEAARSIMEEAGVSYTVLMPWDEALEQFPVYAVPTSFFVDSGGHVLGEPVVGVDVEGYPGYLEAAISLAQESAEGAAS